MDELHAEFNKEHENINRLVKELGLKPDEIKAIEDRTGGKFIPKEEIERYKEFKRLEAENEIEEKESWEPDCSPFDVAIVDDEIEINKISTPNLSNQKRNENYQNEEKIYSRNNRNKNEKSSSKKNKEKGIWGEELAKRCLEKKYKNTDTEVVWMNEKGDVGKGYDFVIRDLQNEDVAYYEIKAKTIESPEFVTITGTQWEWARKLFNEGKGDKYILLVVLNVGTQNAKERYYKNPIKLWKE